MGNTSSLWKGGSDALVDVCRSAHFERVDFSGFKAPSAVLAASRRGPRNGSIESLRSNTNATFSGNSSRPKISTTERFLARADVHDRGARPHAPQRGRRVIILISDDVATYSGGHGTHDIITELIASDAVLYNLKIPGYNPPGTMLHAAMEKGLTGWRENIPPDLLRRRVGDTQADSIRCCQDNRGQEIHIDGSGQLDAMNEQIIDTESKVLREQIFGAGARLLTVRSCHVRVRTENGRSNRR